MLNFGPAKEGLAALKPGEPLRGTPPLTSVGAPLWGLPDGWQELLDFFFRETSIFWGWGWTMFFIFWDEFNGLGMIDRYCWMALVGNDDGLIPSLS